MSNFVHGVSKVVGTVASIAALIPGPHQPIAALVAAGAQITSALTAQRPSNDRQGLQLSFKIDPGAPIPIIVGRTATGSTIVHRETFGENNRYQTYFGVLSGAGPVAGIDGFLADRAAVGFAGTAATGFFNRWMWQDRQLGALPEPRALGHGVVNPPTGSIPPVVPGWGAAYRLSGYAAVSWTLLFDTKAKKFVNGEPQPLWIVRGVLAYDPRKDSTYPGGSGPHRWADPSNVTAHQAARATWEWTESPALIGLMWRLGFWHRDETNPATAYRRVAGIGARIDQIDVAAFVEGANIQQANGWKIGGEISTAQDKWEVCKLIDQAGGGEPIAKGAIMSLMVHAPRVPIATITANDLGEGVIEPPAMRPRKERINQFRPRYRSEAHGWEMVDAGLVSFADLIAEDKSERTRGDDYGLVQDAQQATELAGYEIWSGRERQPIELPLKLAFIGARIGECYVLDIPEAGLIQQTAIVRGRSLDPVTLQPTLAFRGETPAKHAAIFALTGTATPAPVVTVPDGSVAAPSVADWSIEGVTLSANGAAIPAVIATGVVANSTAEAVAFDIRLYEAGQAIEAGWSGASIDPPETTRKVFGTVTPGTQYEVSVRYRVRGATGDRLILGPVTAGRLGITSVEQLLIANSYPVNIAITGADAGGSATVSITGHSRSYQDRTVPVDGGQIEGLANSETFYLFYDDPDRAGGAVTYAATTAYADAFTSVDHPARHYVGNCLTPAPGGGGSEGGGGSPPGGGGYSPRPQLPDN